MMIKDPSSPLYMSNQMHRKHRKQTQVFVAREEVASGLREWIR